MVMFYPCQNQLHAGEIIKYPGEKPATRQFKDDLKRTVVIPANPCRVVVLATADVEILFAVNAGEKLIGMPDGVRYPPEASGIGRIGGMYGNFNAEKIVEKQPDLILFTMSNWEQYRSHIDRLESYGITVLGFHYPDTLDQLISHIKTIGDAVGKKKESCLLCDNITARIQKITTITNRFNISQRPRVYMEWMNDYAATGGTTTHGGKSRESNMVRMAGGINIFSNVEKNSFMACNEEVISRDPEVIILTANLKERNPDELKRIIKSRPGWAETHAVKNNRIYIVEEQITWANPRIVLGIETLLQCLHPELFTAPEGGHHIQK